MTLQTITNFSRYMVDDFGSLYRITITDDAIKLNRISDRVGQSGYVYNTLIADDGRKHCVQRGYLMLLAFKFDSYFDGAECDHIDHDTTNNDVTNLRWLSHRDNCKHRRFRGREKDRMLYLIYDDGSVQFYQSRKHTNIPSPTLSRILSGRHSKKYKCRGFYYDRLHAQSDEVREKVRMTIADAVADSMFVTVDGKLTKLL